MEILLAANIKQDSWLGAPKPCAIPIRIKTCGQIGRIDGAIPTRIKLVPEARSLQFSKVIPIKKGRMTKPCSSFHTFIANAFILGTNKDGNGGFHDATYKENENTNIALRNYERILPQFKTQNAEGINRVLTNIREVQDAVKEDPTLNKKVLDATKSYTKNSSNLSELLTVVKDFDFLGFKTIIESLQAAITTQNDHLAKWVESSWHHGLALMVSGSSLIPKVNKGKGITIGSNPSPLKFVKASREVRHDPDAPMSGWIRNMEAQLCDPVIKKVAYFKVLTRSHSEKLKQKASLRKKRFDQRVFVQKVIFKDYLLVKLNSPEFGLFSDIEERSKEEATKIMMETMEQYMSKTLRDYGSGITRPKINTDTHFELNEQFLKELRDNTFSGSEHEDANEHIEKVLEIEVILFYNRLDVPTRQILDSKGAIPTKTVANCKVAIKED
ncbi:hypothetical protein Tco_1429825 [Tanacetum coccineum]